MKSKNIEWDIDTPDPSWSKKQENELHQWEILTSSQTDHEAMHMLLFTPDGELRHVNGYREGKRI